jgi:hypothetical protein
MRTPVRHGAAPFSTDELQAAESSARGRTRTRPPDSFSFGFRAESPVYELPAAG